MEEERKTRKKESRKESKQDKRQEEGEKKSEIKIEEKRGKARKVKESRRKRKESVRGEKIEKENGVIKRGGRKGKHRKSKGEIKTNKQQQKMVSINIGETRTVEKEILAWR